MNYTISVSVFSRQAHFLVAHEVGHSELGDDAEAGPPVQIDPARSVEPSPVGIDRVVDYGRRQRREGQMDLFSREFLLPREFVRKLHLVDIDGTAPFSDAEELNRRVADAFAAHGLADHGYVNDYKAFALPMLRYFASIREDHTPEPPMALSLTFNNERIIVRPDDVLIKPDGKRTFRRVKTGHQHSNDSEDIEAAALMIAAKHAFPDATIELVYLSDQKAEPLSMSSTKLENRREKLDNFLKDIRLGRFPANPSPRTCPSCPAFFVCGPTPQGVLQKQF